MTADLKPVTKAEWLAALRSGQFPQTREQLQDEHGFCCLGVLCTLAGVEKDRLFEVEACLPEGEQASEFSPYKALGLDGHIPGFYGQIMDKLSIMNDDGESFESIAAWIEENISDAN